MKAKSIISLMLLSGILIAGCATSQKLQIVQSGDNKLSCEQLLYEMKKLEEAQAQVDSNKGVTGNKRCGFLVLAAWACIYVLRRRTGNRSH